MAANSTRRLDVIAQYWQLLASPDDPRSGDYGYTQDQMHKFGDHQGAAVYQALDDAADRNVNIRCVSILLISLMVIVKLELNSEH
jgi:phospholipase D3/4